MIKLSKEVTTFFDFCAGIGTARMALESLGLQCVGHAEIDPIPNRTYQLFFGADETNWGDLMSIRTQELPDFDLMVAGFPCQTFSIAGKRNGMNDQRGLIIHGLCDILKVKRPNYFLLENVKGLIHHDSGRTLTEILRLLDQAGYNTNHQVLKSTEFGVPQIRERIFLLGSHKDLDTSIPFPQQAASVNPLSDYLIDTREKFIFDFHSPAGATLKRYLSNKYNRGRFDWDALMQQPYLVLDTRQSDLRCYENVIPTLRTGRHGILYIRDGVLRRLSGYESLLLQGVPNEIAQRADPISTTHLLSQAGNAMTVDVIKALGQQFVQSAKKS